MADPIIEAQRAASAGLSKLVRDELAGFFGSLDLSKPDAVRDALLEFVPLLVSEYGSVAESLALDYYDEMRAASGAAGSFRAVAGASRIPAAAVEAKVRYLAGHLWTPEPAAMLGGLLAATDKYVKQPGRDAIAFNARREGVRWARVPQGSRTCAFCLLVASRDAVYLTKRAAGDRRNTGKGDAFHGLCDCAVVRIAKPSDYPTDYLPDDYLGMYEDAAKNADSGSVKDIAAKMRELYPDRLTDGHVH